MELHLPSFLLTILPLFMITLMLVIRKRTTYISGTRARSPPGPWKLPIIGSLQHMVGGTLPHHALRGLAGIHGPLMLLRLGQVDHIVVSSPEFAEEIMKTHDLNFASRPQLIAAKEVCYDFTDVAFSPYGSYWRQLRKICVIELLSAKRIKSFSSLREEEVSNMINCIAMSTTKPINLTEMLESMSNTIVFRAAFGDKCRHQQKLLWLIKDIIKAGSSFNVADLFPSLQFINVISGLNFKLKRIRCQLDEICDEVIKEHRADKDDTQHGNKLRGENLVDVLLRIQDHGKLEIPITDDNIKAVIMDMFTAGTETSSGLTDWAMAELMKNPKAMNKAQKEVREALEGKRKVEESDLGKLKFLKLIIKETLRLHPPFPVLLPRVCKAACQILGYEISAGCRVIVNAWAMGRDPRYWEEAERFKPERFDGSTVDFKGSNFEFLPFGAGRRMCPGIGFGLATVELALAQLLFYFDWELPGGMAAEDLDMSETFGSTAARKSKLCLLAIPHIPAPTV